MDRLQIAEATIVGWSTGGEIGLSLAERHPGKVASLVVVGATAGGPTAVQPSAAVQKLFASNSQKLLGLLFPPSAAAAQGAYIQEVEPSRQVLVKRPCDRRK